MEKRLDHLKIRVNALVENCGERRGPHYVHLHGVSLLCALLAAKRGLEPEIAAAMGLLHDISVVSTGNYDDHTLLSAHRARELLREIDGFREADIEWIATAIENHDNVGKVEAPYDEVLKDADILQPYLANPAVRPGEKSIPRLEKLYEELGLVGSLPE